ncbi:MAG: zinc ribbon domain-containing protein [Candidatus Aminicenantes bacterium]|nr:zinc ribbon domain-containing protein [Candidatus Aminicenantes bacterium]
MPIYEYRCKKCHRQFEILQKLNEKSLDKCPECGGQLTKLISSPAIQFKGSGWYITDYAHKNSPSGGNGHNGHKNGKEATTSSSKKLEKKEESRAADK